VPWFNYIFKLIKVLNQDATPAQIAGGVALGAIVGLIPKLNLLALAICVIILLVRVNISMAMLATVLFAIVGALTDPVVEKLGYYLLTDIPSLTGFYTSLYNISIIPWTNFNNSLVLGNFVVGVLAFVPIFIVTRVGVIQYRKHLLEKIRKWKVMQIIKASKIYQLYDQFRGGGVD
jgi:uncharacterized protein (TIGR03546 family)